MYLLVFFQGESDKEFEKYSFSLVFCRGRYMDVENLKSVRLRDFSPPGQNADGQQPHAMPYIGLQHVNKNPKRARYDDKE